METKKVAEMIHAVLTDDKIDLGKIDSSDIVLACTPDAMTGDRFSFKLYENVDRPNPDYRGRGLGRTIPVGHFEYKVEVTRTWCPMEEEDMKNVPNT